MEVDDEDSAGPISKRSGSRSKRSVSRTGGDSKSQMAKTAQNFKFDLPPSCHMTLVKRLLIDKMPGKYFLASHPYPKIEGELMIIRPKKEDQSSKDAVIYRDYSLRKRLETMPVVL